MSAGNLPRSLLESSALAEFLRREATLEPRKAIIYYFKYR